MTIMKRFCDCCGAEIVEYSQIRATIVVSRNQCHRIDKELCEECMNRVISGLDFLIDTPPPKPEKVTFTFNGADYTER